MWFVENQNMIFNFGQNVFNMASGDNLIKASGALNDWNLINMKS